MKKEYFVFADNLYKNTTVDRIREFLKFSCENGFRYRYMPVRVGVKKIQVKKGRIYVTTLRGDAPYIDIVYTTKTGERYYRVYENRTYNRNAAARILYALNKYAWKPKIEHGYSKHDLEEIE